MKRRGVLFIIVIAAVGFLLLFVQRKGKSSGEDLSSSAPSAFPSAKSETPVSQEPKPTAAAKADPTLARPEPVFFSNDVAAKNNLENLPPKPQRDQTAFPSGPADLRVSPLWTDGQWKVWKGVSVADARAFSGGKNLGKMGSWMLREDPSVQSDERQFSPKSPIPVYNSARNRVGLITGSFSLVIPEDHDFQSLVLDYGLAIRGAFPNIKTYYVMSAKDPFDLQALYEALKQDPRVEQVNIEVVTQSNVKK